MDKELICSAKMEPLCKLEAELLVISNVSCTIDVGYKVVFLDINRKDLSSLVDDDHAVSLLVASGHDAELVCELLAEEQTG